MPRTLVKPRPLSKLAPLADPETLRFIRTPIAYMTHPDFGRKAIDESFPVSMLETTPPSERASGSLPPYLAQLYETPLLTKDDERTLFTLMNWFKYKAEQIRQSLHPTRPSPRKMAEIRELLEKSAHVRNRIVQANLRLVVSLARKFCNPVHSLDELISEGHLPLIRAVELFNISLGNRFSTYATWAIRNHLARHVGLQKKRGELIGHADEGFFDSAPDLREEDPAAHREIDRQRKMMSQLLPRLSARDQQVVEARFGLNDHDRSQTLSEIAGELGLSKERVRQLVMQAVDRLRAYANELKM
jgi:RNA polymerase sigma factor (sigma-70 family)